MEYANVLRYDLSVYDAACLALCRQLPIATQDTALADAARIDPHPMKILVPAAVERSVNRHIRLLSQLLVGGASPLALPRRPC